MSAHDSDSKWRVQSDCWAVTVESKPDRVHGAEGFREYRVVASLDGTGTSMVLTEDGELSIQHGVGGVQLYIDIPVAVVMSMVESAMQTWADGDGPWSPKRGGQ